MNYVYVERIQNQNKQKCVVTLGHPPAQTDARSILTILVDAKEHTRPLWVSDMRRPVRDAPKILSMRYFLCFFAQDTRRSIVCKTRRVHIECQYVTRIFLTF
jgi:hypothetical protein